MQKTNAIPGYQEKAANHGNKWLWRRIKGLRQWLQRNPGENTDIADKLAVLEGILSARGTKLKRLATKEKEIAKQLKEAKILVERLSGKMKKTASQLSDARMVSKYGEGDHLCHLVRVKHPDYFGKIKIGEKVAYTLPTIRNPLKYPEKLEAIKQMVKKHKKV